MSSAASDKAIRGGLRRNSDNELFWNHGLLVTSALDFNTRVDPTCFLDCVQWIAQNWYLPNKLINDIYNIKLSTRAALLCSAFSLFNNNTVQGMCNTAVAVSVNIDGFQGCSLLLNKILWCSLIPGRKTFL